MNGAKVNVFYFESMNDFISTLLRVNNVWAVLNSVLLALLSFVTGYLYHDASTVVLIVCLMLADLVTGIYASMVKKADAEGVPLSLRGAVTAIQSRKLLRSFIAIVFHLMLLSSSWHISRHEPFLGFLPGLLVGAICTTQFVSVVENLYKAKVVKAALLDVVGQRLNLGELLKKRETKDGPKG